MESIKDNTYILNNPEEFRAVLQRAEEYFKKEYEVVSVGFGNKISNGVCRDEIALMIFVEEKKKLEDLEEDQVIPERFEGYLVDICTAKLEGTLGACDNTTDYTTEAKGIRGGMQIAPSIVNSNWDVGTLGYFVRKRHDSSRENIYALSNKHVLYGVNNVAGDYAYHPFAKGMQPQPQHVFPNMSAAETSRSNSLGPIQVDSNYGNLNYTTSGGGNMQVFADCAMVRLDLDCTCLGTVCTKDRIKYQEEIIDLQVNNINTISDVRNLIGDPTTFDPAHPENKVVYKVGRTTGRTKGIIQSVGASILDVPVDFNNQIPTQTAFNTIRIDFDPTSTANGLNCHDNAFFSEKGDSGSLIVDHQNKAVGLLFYVPILGSHADVSAACHIVPILDHLGVCIPTTGGTSHGSCGATDGSGLTPGPGVPGSGGAASTISGSAFTATNSDLTAGLFEPTPLSDTQQDRLSDLLDALRSTKRGRDLHEAFGYVRREIGYLVRNRRPVTVTWHRNKGPGFFAAFLNHLRGDQDTFPNQVGSADLSVLLDKMEVVLHEHGSNPLREAIENHGDLIKTMLLSGSNVQEFIDHLNRIEKI